MRLNDKESYVVKKELLEAATKGIYESERTIVSEDVLTRDTIEKTGEILYMISLQINRQIHHLYYDDENARNADFDLVSKAIS